MLIVHHELLPAIYLLVLAPDPACASELEFAHYLNCAVRSGKPAVWVDCRLLDTISPTAARLLLACRHRLQRRGAQLTLCRVSERVAQALQQAGTYPTPALHLASGFDEAAAYLYKQANQ